MSGYAPRNPLRKFAKTDLPTMVRGVDLFAHGVSLETASKALKLSRKSARGLYIELRDRLAEPVFARWHRANVLLPAIASPEQNILLKSAFMDILAECHSNLICYRNYRAGRRASPLCRNCPLHGKFTGQAIATEAAQAMHQLRGFYHRIGIHAETGRDPVALFRLRFIHLVSIATVVQNSRRLSASRLDPNEKTFLSFGTFREVMIAHFIDRPEP